MGVRIHVGDEMNIAKGFIMRNRKKAFVGMAALFLLFGFVAAGCVTATPVAFAETEASQEIFQAASDLLALQEGRIEAGELVSGLSDRFPGLSLVQFHGGGIDISYQDRIFSISCAFDRGGATIYIVRAGSIVTSILQARERVEPEQDGQ